MTLHPFPPKLPHLSRRSFLGLGAAATGAVLLSACGGAAETATPTTVTPRDGGRLRAVFAGGGAQEVLDPPHKTNLYADVARANASTTNLSSTATTSDPSHVSQPIGVPAPTPPPGPSNCAPPSFTTAGRYGQRMCSTPTSASSNPRTRCARGPHSK